MLCHWCLVLPSERERHIHTMRVSMVLIMAAPISAIIFLMPPFWCCFQFEFCRRKKVVLLRFCMHILPYVDGEYFVIWAADSVGARSCHGNKMMFCTAVSTQMPAAAHSSYQVTRDTILVQAHGRITGVTLHAGDDLMTRMLLSARNAEERPDWEQQRPLSTKHNAISAVSRGYH